MAPKVWRARAYYTLLPPSQPRRFPVSNLHNQEKESFKSFSLSLSFCCLGKCVYGGRGDCISGGLSVIC